MKTTDQIKQRIEKQRQSMQAWLRDDGMEIPTEYLQQALHGIEALQKYGKYREEILREEVEICDSISCGSIENCLKDKMEAYIGIIHWILR